MKKCRLWIGCMIALVLVFPLHVSAAAACPTDAPYQTYIYNMKDQPVAIPAAFSVEQVVTGDGITDRAFNSLGDICYNGSGRLFISDSGNDRVLMTDLDFRVLAVISEFSVAVSAISSSPSPMIGKRVTLSMVPTALFHTSSVPLVNTFALLLLTRKSRYFEFHLGLKLM